MKNVSIKLFCVALLLLGSFTRCSTASSLLSSGSSLMSALGGSANLSQFTNLLKTPGLDKLVGGALKEPFTLLAPTNDAINSLGSSGMSDLTSNVDKLANLVKGQIVPGKLDAAGVAKSGLTSASGKPVDLSGAQMGDMIAGDKFNIIPVNKILGQ